MDKNHTNHNSDWRSRDGKQVYRKLHFMRTASRVALFLLNLWTFKFRFLRICNNKKTNNDNDEWSNLFHNNRNNDETNDNINKNVNDDYATTETDYADAKHTRYNRQGNDTDQQCNAIGV